VRSKLGSRKRPILALLGAAVAAAAVLTYTLSRTSGQAQVSADSLPVVAGAHRVAAFTDCSKVNSLAYFEDNPCETFVLLRGGQFTTQAAFLAAEARQLVASGWQHPTIAPPIDYNVGGAMAAVENSWFAPKHAACGYVATDQAAVAAEASELIPFDRYDNPRGMLAFYRTAKAAQSENTLWVRLRPHVMVEPRAC
jgi:hypothetical protein